MAKKSTRKPMSKADRAAFAERMKAARAKSGKTASKKPSGKIPFAMGKLKRPGGLYTEAGKPFKPRATKARKAPRANLRIASRSSTPTQRISRARRAHW